MAESVVVRTASFDSLLRQISTKFGQAEAADVILELKRLYPTRKDSFDHTNFYGALIQLYELGAIDDDGDQKLLEFLAEKTSENKEIEKLLTSYKKGSSPRQDDFVGRDVDVSNILKLVKNHSVPGVNLFGDSGVGKTTLAKEVSKRLNSFDTVFIDLRNIKCLKNVYFHILQALHLPSWDDNNRERIYKHLENLNRKTVLILDNIEQLLQESDAEQETRADFLEFLNVIIGSEASKRGHLKVILTSTTELNESKLKHKMFTEYNVQPFSNDVSKDFISRRAKSDLSDAQQDETMYEIADLCRNNPYLLQGAEQMMRESFAKPADVLRKITAQPENGVPKQFACISALFESLPNDHLKQVAVKISLLRRPFSVSTAMKISAEISAYDAELDLELLAIHRIITAEDAELKRPNETKKKRKYDLHALFRDFVTSHLCKKDLVYKEQLKNGEKQFFRHFSGKLTKLATNLESEFVKTYSKIEINRANFELAIHLSEENKETLDLLLHTDDHNQFALMGILFEVLEDERERRELFGKWASAAKEQGKWLACAMLHCWESVCTYASEASKAKLALVKAQSSFEEVKASRSLYSDELLRSAESLYRFARGRLHLLIGEKVNITKDKAREHLQKGILDLEESLTINRHMYGDHTLTARNLALLGDCYLRFHGPENAEPFYLQALDMKIKLVGSNNHFEIPRYYNQMAQVHERLGRQEQETWYSFFSFNGKGRKEYEKAVEWVEKALALQEKLGVSDRINTATFQSNLAIILIGLGKYDQALEYAQKSFEIRNKHLGKHSETVRILYLIGIIHEWREDHKAALRSYEEAFVMEESLPADNHSVVRKLLCDRLKAMLKRLNKKDKLKEYGPRTQSIMEIRSPASSPTEENLDFNYQNEKRESPSSIGLQKEEEDVACSEILINICVKKRENILSAPGRSDVHEPICVSYTVFKKVVTSNKPIKFIFMSNGCSEEAVSEVELKGYTEVARSKTEVNVEKEADLKLDASYSLGGRDCSPIVQRTWQIKKEQLWTFEKLSKDPGTNLQLCLSFYHSRELLFKDEHPVDMQTLTSSEGVGSSIASKDEEFIKEKLGLRSGDNIDDFFGKCENFALDQPQHRVSVSELEETIRKLKHSIGAIIATNISNVPEFGATCFRIGTKYVITNKHVISEIRKLRIPLSRCHVDFNYKEEQQGYCARFAAPNPVLFSSDELDYAILELCSNDGEGFPPSVTELGFNIAPPGRQLRGGECLTFIGHPIDLKKQIDVSCPIMLQQDNQKYLHNYHLFCMIQKACTHPDHATYDVSTFFKGASGSPGILMQKKLLVVLHSGGILLRGTNKPHVLEYGTLISSVVKDVMLKINNGTIQNGSHGLDDIFGGSTSSIFDPRSAPMDIDQDTM